MVPGEIWKWTGAKPEIDDPSIGRSRCRSPGSRWGGPSKAEAMRKARRGMGIQGPLRFDKEGGRGGGEKLEER